MREKVIYTSSGEVLSVEEIKKLPLIGEGGYGSVYKYDEDKVIKLLPCPFPECNYSVIELICKLGLPNFYHIYDLLSESKTDKKYIGTISSYHKPEKLNIWTMPSDWLVENYERLQEAVIKLGEQEIKIIDMKKLNSIVNRSGITIIDVDKYWTLDFKCIEDNLETFYYNFFINLIGWSLYDYDRNLWLLGESEEIIEDLIVSKEHNAKELSKKLSGFQRPIDYLKSRIDT